MPLYLGKEQIGGISTLLERIITINNQEKSVEPTRSVQEVSPDEGYTGLSKVTVGAIPDTLQDISGTTATEQQVLHGAFFVDQSGNLVSGTMVNHGAVSETLDTNTTRYSIPSGYHSGSGTISISTEEKTVTPTKVIQDIVPTDGSVLSKVTIDPIPDNYIDTSDATATASEMNAGVTAYINGQKITGEQVIQHVYTGSVEPDDSIGVDGDLYLML